MKRSAIFKSLKIFIVCLLVFCTACPALAIGLTEFKQQVAAWQNDPTARAKQLSDIVERMQAMEEGLARQSNITVTRVLNLEQMYNSMQNMYYSVYYIQKHNSATSNFQIDDDQLRAIASQKPPYSYLFYLDALQAENAGLNQINNQQAMYNRAVKQLQGLALKQNDLERKYRIAMSKMTDPNVDEMAQRWSVEEISAELELCLTQKTFYSISKSLAESDLATAHTRYDAIFSMVSKIRGDITFNGDDFIYLDALINGNTAKLLETIKNLDGRYKKVTDLLKNSRNNDFVQYRLHTEQELLEDELLMLEDMMEWWYSLRAKWRAMRDVLTGKLLPEDQQMVLDSLSAGIDSLNGDISNCNQELHKIDEAQRMTVKRFGGSEEMSPDDSARLGEFLDSIDSMKYRTLGYIVDCGTIRAYYVELEREMKDILKKDPSEKMGPVGSRWKQRFDEITEFEIWHFDDFPVTIGKLVYSLFTFVIVMALALSISYFIKLRTRKKRVSRHTALLVEKFVDYTGFILAFLCALWSLRIPLTAFAFLGGAVAIAVGFGTQKIIGDIFSGIMMLFQKKLRVGDQVIINGKRGTVTEITLQNTVLLCEQSKYLIIPNSKVQDSELINLTLNSPDIRVELSVGIAYESDVNKAIEIMMRVLKDDDGVLKAPAPRILVDSLDDSSVKLTAQYYTDLRVCIDERTVQSRLRKNVLSAFAEAGVVIPFPQTEVRIKKD